MSAPWRPIIDHRDETSLAAAMRRRRMVLFQALLAPLHPPVTILDVGGEQRFWEVVGLADNPNYHFVILNLRPPQVSRSNFRGLVGDASDLSYFADRQFDCVFSNSVIEHLGSYEKQRCMAAEMRRVGAYYFVQTPNRYFPLEPHFLLPWFQFFPLHLRVALLQRFRLGWYPRIADYEQASQLVRSHRLLNWREMRALFPEATLYREKLLGLTKSLIAYGRSSPSPA